MLKCFARILRRTVWPSLFFQMPLTHAAFIRLDLAHAMLRDRTQASTSRDGCIGLMSRMGGHVPNFVRYMCLAQPGL